MKKVILLLTAFIISACSNSEERQALINGEQLDTPQKTEVGFIRLSQNSQYYVDTSSIWVDSSKNNLINFDTVINLHIGHRIFEDKNLMTKSVRQHKVLDCQTNTMKHTGSHLYSDFWGEGTVFTPKKYREHQVKPRDGSTLGTVAQVMCANFYH
ncbi:MULTISPECIES: surface-adhesin E family protein [unclassified Lonepinella]|uniref:surface-adhesin E family protein n=1 Tax=unclassified Lonepinella TaxID=2642006 RepID=UPI003F6E151C